MQIGAMNSINFTSCNHAQCKSGMQRHKEVVEEAKTNVSPLTCIAGTLTALAAVKNGSKLVGAGRRVVAGAGEAISTVALKGAKKIKNSINIDKATAKVQSFFGKLSAAGSEANPKLEKTVTETIDFVFSGKDQAGKILEGKGKKFIEELKNKGIVMNGASLFDNAVAAAGAYIVADGVSDATESIIDKKKIKESFEKNLGVLL